MVAGREIGFVTVGHPSRKGTVAVIAKGHIPGLEKRCIGIGSNSKKQTCN
jgi:hypothetical protein